jgi:drug/metabolite transporter (DMT)-like permease
MNFRLLLTLIGYSFGMACGQILFKVAAQKIALLPRSSSLIHYINVYLLAGMLLYVALTILWVWILRSSPLSRVYPFVALAFIFTPLLAHFQFSEKLTSGYFFGLALIVAGIVVLARQ